MALTQDDGLDNACGDDPSILCQWIYETTGSEGVTTLSENFIAKPIRIALIMVGAFVGLRLARRFIRRWAPKLAARGLKSLHRVDRRTGKRAGESTSRAELRAATVISVATSLLTVVVWAAAAVLIINQFDFNLTALFAGAGIAGIALGFGAQSVVADFLSGSFMLFEDQFGVGDVVDVGEVTGVVEEVSLRTTTLRDVHGTVWHIRNSEIKRIANKSQLWSRAVLDIDVAYDTDLRRAEGVIQRVADELWQDDEFEGGDIIDPPEVWGIERLGADGVSIRLVVKTDPAEQFVIARELRLRIKEALDDAGIEIPFPQRTIWIREDGTHVPRHERPIVETVKPRSHEAAEELMTNP